MPPPYDSSDELDPMARANRIQNQQAPQGNHEWEPVQLPGMLPIDEIPQAPEAGSLIVPATPGAGKADLLALVQDLNRCNEVLLSRVNQLEEASETSQQTLQQEVERSQVIEADRVAAAKQQSVAQLLSELEQSNAALKRQTILSETLQAQLETYQERSKHLERECALAQKRAAEKAQKLQVMEEACSDLKSRLQRQQRYTLQFKVALEKCLDTSAGNQASPDVCTGAVPETSLAQEAVSPHPAAMPRSERIQPWSATETVAQVDSQLLSLARSLTPPTQLTPRVTESSAAADAKPSNTPELAPEGEAEQQLWQDVERVIENSAPADPKLQEAAASDASVTQEAQFTEPFPWGAPVKKEQEDPAIAPSDDSPKQTLLEKSLLERSLRGREVPTGQTTESFTPKEDVEPEKLTDVVQEYSQLPATAEIPALNAVKASQASPSPIVHPLRPTQRKRKSLSAVELPTFPPLPKPQNRG